LTVRFNRQVVIFARAPRLGVGKKRLASDVGRAAAHRFYRNNLMRLIAELADGPWRLAVAVTDPAETEAPVFAGLPTSWQGEGDLGARMARVLRWGGKAPAGPLVVVGSDIPDLGRGAVEAAFAALRRNDAVFGPSRDGGYYLVGASGRTQLPRGFMDGVRWSGPHALSDTVATLRDDWRVGMLDPLDDVDDGPDYWAWKERIR